MRNIQVEFVMILALARFKILDHSIHSSRNRQKVKLLKSTPANNHLLDKPEGRSPIRESVWVFHRVKCNLTGASCTGCQAWRGVNVYCRGCLKRL